MVKNKAAKTNSQNPGARTPLILLGNSSKNQLKSEAKQWVKQSQRESKDWARFSL